ncbi:27570_t:CDS:10 [Gigaspora margarita]|uniref:27570_t:CDS:1 n=1 Tax=Gigaspora margarita TaxID=4874 RepID=A0ABN7UC21_GIGMA|nr:27570_t:CDS:10 [Gigaspora margarita]
MAHRSGGRRKNVKKGFQFTLMVVGASGTGRSTFVNTLCGSEVLAKKLCDTPETAHVEAGIRIKPVTVELDEDGARIALTIEIMGYLERQYDDILAEESRIKRNPRFRDNRIDIELMKRLSPRVNVIPVIGKADTCTPAELAEFKRMIMEDIEHYNIPIYNFPFDVEEDDEETVEENSELRALLPFAIIGSEEEIIVNGRSVRGRQYPWGVVEVLLIVYAYPILIIISSHLQDLKEITHDFLYENYRTEKLSRSADNSTPEDANILPDELATQGVRIKEEQLKREEEKLREIELKVQREISEKRQELLAKEEALRNLEARLAQAQDY